MSSTIPFVSSGVVNTNIVLPVTQDVASTIYTLSSDHFSCRFGCSEINFVVTGTANLSLDLNIPSGAGITVNVAVDGGSNTALTAVGRANYAVTLPNSSDHLITISLPSGSGVYVDFYNIIVDTGGNFGNPYGTLPGTQLNGQEGFGVPYCALNVAGNGLQSWIDLAAIWAVDHNYVDNALMSFLTDAQVRFYAKGSSIRIFGISNTNQAAVVVPRIDGTDYAPVTLTGKGGYFQWEYVGDSASMPKFDNTTFHEVVLTFVQYGASNAFDLGGIMVGGAGAAIQTSAITPLHRIIVQGDSITEGNAFWNHSLYTNSNWPYKAAKALGVLINNVGVGGQTVTDYYYPAAGYTGSGNNQGGGTNSIVYRYNHAINPSIPALPSGTYDWLIDFSGTNDLQQITSGVQIPLLGTDAPSAANNTIPTFTATGGTGGASPTITTSASFATANLGQKVTGTSGINNGKVGYIVGVSGGTLTIEPQGGMTWGAAANGDHFAVTGVNFVDMKTRSLLLFLNNSTFSSTKLLIANLNDRSAGLPVNTQGAGSTPSQLSDYRTQIHNIYTTLAAAYPGRVFYADLAGVTGTTTNEFDGLHPNNAGTDLIYPVIVNAIQAASAATSYTLTGPSSGYVGMASSGFTVTPNGTLTGTITPSDSGGGGTFSPSSLTWTGNNSAKTFTYTPGSAGTKTISTTNSASLADASSLTYTASTVPVESAVITQTSAVYHLAGTNTNWTGTPFSLVGVGAATLSQTINSPTSADLTITAGGQSPPYLVTDGVKTFQLGAGGGGGGRTMSMGL